jgi:hypothetical protein
MDILEHEKGPPEMVLDVCGRAKVTLSLINDKLRVWSQVKVFWGNYDIH